VTLCMVWFWSKLRLWKRKNLSGGGMLHMHMFTGDSEAVRDNLSEQTRDEASV